MLTPRYYSIQGLLTSGTVILPPRSVDSGISGAERAFIAAAVAAMIALPPYFIEMYPFSTFPMFTDAPRTIVRTSATLADGEPLSLHAIGISEFYVANAQPKLNASLERSIDAAYRFWRPDEFVPLVQARLQAGLPGPVFVEQRLIGAQEIEGRQTLGIIAKRRWRISLEGVSAVDE